MSTPESIVVSLEKAKELEACGYPQESAFMENWSFENGKVGVVMPTAEEILRQLPNKLESSGDYFFLNCHREKEWEVSYYSMAQDYSCWINDSKVEGKGGTLADASASLWIYLSKNNLLPKA